MADTRLKYVRWGSVLLLLLMVWPVYSFMIRYTIHMFGDPLEDMSHGWLVPVVSAYVVWWRRAQLRAAAGMPSWRGFLWVCLFMAVCWVGGRGAQSRLEQVSFIGLILTVPYAFWGAGVARLMVFPAAFLVFTIPISSFADMFTVHLRILASSLAMAVLNGVGLAVEQSGTALFSRVAGGEFSVDVAEPCSGIRSLFAMMALTAAYAFFTQKHILQKWALFACSVPLAVIGNVCRIFSICLVATWFGQKTALGFYHDFSGYIIFLVGVLLMVQMGHLIGKHERWFTGISVLNKFLERRGADRCERAGKSLFPTVLPVLGVLLLATCIFASKFFIPPAVFEAADFVSPVFPDNVGEFIGDTPWFCQNENCMNMVEEHIIRDKCGNVPERFQCPECGGKMLSTSLSEKTILPTDTTVIKRNYTSADGLVYRVTAVISGRSRASIHRAELCLPAQGFVMLAAGKKALDVPSGAPKKVRMILATKPGASPMTLLYWFASRNRESCSHVSRIWTDIWDRSIHNRVNRWVMISINVSSALDTPESFERLEAFLSEFYPQVVKKP